MYIVKVEEQLHKKAKGIPKMKVDKDLEFENYKKTLEDNTRDKIEFKAIRAKKHELYTISQEKTGLSNYDDKRFYLNNTESLPYGHYEIQ